MVKVLRSDCARSVSQIFVACATIMILSCSDGAASSIVSSTCSGSASPSTALEATQASTSAVVIENVPAYRWYHGCGPTAAASILGYWDINGYGNIFDATGDDVFLTSNVKDHISSPAHNAKYDPTTNAPWPAPEPDSIASFFRTSVDPLRYGWSYNRFADDAFMGYADHRGYDFFATQSSVFDGFSWDQFVSEINSQRPSLFLVDTNSDGSTDHFVPAIGYDDRGALGRYYGFYTTRSESETVEWRRFAPIAAGVSWGVYGATMVGPVSVPAPIPVPAPFVLLASAFGILGLTGVIRRHGTK